MSTAMQTMKSANRNLIDETKALNSQLSHQSRIIRELSRTAGMSAIQLASDWAYMSKEMKQSLIRNHNELQKHRKDLLAVQNDMRKLGMQMGHYTGSTKDFMNEIQRLGKAHKKISDQMINNNLSLRQGFIQTIATMSAMSNTSEKIIKNYDRMGKSVYLVNKPLLAVTNHLENMVKKGNATYLALKMLGPNAKMKELQDMVMYINQGLMRQQAVVMAAGVAWLGFTSILANAALGPDPAEIRKQQQQITNIYREEWQRRVDEIANFAGLFEKVSIPKVKASDLTKALQSQVNAIKTWRTNLQGLMKKGVDEGLIQELQKMGPAAAGQVKALNAMSKSQLDKYVALWREKMGLAKQQATSELAQLKQQTDAKVRALQNSLTPLGIAWENFKQTWAVALKPFVDFWGQIAAKVVNLGTAIGRFVQRLNEINPWITKLAGMFVYLASTLVLVLSPLAIGIGYIAGLKAAFAAAWTAIKPLTTGLAGMGGTVALVSALIIGLGVAFYLLWTRSETFRNAVISGWNAIKQKALEIWGFLKPYINQAISAITNFVHAKIVQLRAFWDNNGALILQATRNVFGVLAPIVRGALSVISAIFHAVFPLLVSLVKSVWGNIKGVINGSLNVIMGLIKIFAGLFTGNFHKMWEGIKQTFSGTIQFIWNAVQLVFIGRMLGAFRGFVTVGKSIFRAGFTGMRNIIGSIITGIRSVFVSVFNSIRSNVSSITKGITNVATTSFRALLNSSTRIFVSLRSFVSSIWTGIKSIIGSLARSAWDIVKTNFKGMLNIASSLTRSIWRTITTTWNSIISFLKSINLKSIGASIIKGLINGIGSMAGALAKKINSLISGINWVMDKIGIHFKIPPLPVPRYAKGTKYHPGGPAIVGDGGGPELIRTPNGQVMLSPATSTLVNLPKGSEVLPYRETKALLKSGLIPAYKWGIGSKIKDFASKVVSTVKNIAGKAWTGAKEAVGKAKNIALDVWEYIDNPTKLMQKVFEKFGVTFPDNYKGALWKLGKGALDLLKNKAILFVKKKLESFLSVGSVGGSKNVAKWIRAAMAITKVPASWFKPLVAIAMKESGGNPRAINLWDINAKRGTPSKGLMQTIDPTFNAYKLPGLNDIWNPIHNAVAAIRYIKARYGSVFNVPGIRNMTRGKGYVGYKKGGVATKPQLAALAEKGWKEYIIPTEPRMRKRAHALLSQANAELGYTPSVSGTVGKPYVINNKHHIEININGNADSETVQKIKQEVQKILDDHYKKLDDLFGPEVVY
ncbi:hypothetical protein C0971_10000 [Bacillus methanolicus]|nr:hypothetical protein C0971_10000 [Bacillus methanolicus]